MKGFYVVGPNGVRTWFVHAEGAYGYAKAILGTLWWRDEDRRKHQIPVQ